MTECTASCSVISRRACCVVCQSVGHAGPQRLHATISQRRLALHAHAFVVEHITSLGPYPRRFRSWPHSLSSPSVFTRTYALDRDDATRSRALHGGDGCIAAPCVLPCMHRGAWRLIPDSCAKKVRAHPRRTWCMNLTLRPQMPRHRCKIVETEIAQTPRRLGRTKYAHPDVSCRRPLLSASDASPALICKK